MGAAAASGVKAGRLAAARLLVAALWTGVLWALGYIAAPVTPFQQHRITAVCLSFSSGAKE